MYGSPNAADLVPPSSYVVDHDEMSLRTEFRVPEHVATGIGTVSVGCGDLIGEAVLEVPLRVIGERTQRVEVDRLAASERIGAALAVSARSFDQAEPVLVARADDPADALAAAHLAAALGAPVLLTSELSSDEMVGILASRPSYRVSGPRGRWSSGGRWQ